MTSVNRSGKDRESLLVGERMGESGVRDSHTFCHMMEFNLLPGQEIEADTHRSERDTAV